MKHLLAVLTVVGLTLAGGINQSWAGSLDFGIGLGFASSADDSGFEGGWDLIGGYEGGATQNWTLGGQLHLIKGWTNKSKFNDYPSDTTMYFDSTALLATARPRHEWLDWLQLKAGLVNADYKTLALEGSGTGLALGVGAVIGGDTFRVHLLDVEQYWVGGHRFTTVTISIGVLFGGPGRLEW
ncbi:MAG TPA: hypothetical protein VIU93_04160 [Gallionellaceae bacterium]